MSRSTTADLGACTKVVSTSNGPFGGPSASTSNSTTTLLAAECSRLASLLTQVTEEDAAQPAEAAPVDTTACSLTVRCKSDAERPRLSVQRSTGGTDAIAHLIQELERQ